MTLKGGTSLACARCKYQRRKCTSECALAPYFPPDQPKIFQNAHRLFGVSNILKILKDLDPNQKIEAMRSIIYQANIRNKFAVHGCLGVIMQYQYQIQRVEEELNVIQLQLGMTPSQYTCPFPPENYPSLHSCFRIANLITPNLSPGGYIDSKDNMVNSFLIQQPCNSYNNQITIQASQPLTIQQKVVQDCEFFDDRQSYIDSKQAYESSSESSLKDATQSLEHVAENELKSAAACFSLAENELNGAAACFSLTSVN